MPSKNPKHYEPEFIRQVLAEANKEIDESRPGWSKRISAKYQVPDTTLFGWVRKWGKPENVPDKARHPKELAGSRQFIIRHKANKQMEAMPDFPAKSSIQHPQEMRELVTNLISISKDRYIRLLEIENDLLRKSI
jgi:transposase-like protein